VSPRVEASEGVVQPVARKPAHQHAYHAEEVEKTNVLGVEAIEVGQIQRNGGVDADHPREVEEIVNKNQEDRNLGDCDDRAHHRLHEASLIQRLGLLNAEDSLDPSATGWLRGIDTPMPVEERLIYEE